MGNSVDQNFKDNVWEKEKVLYNELKDGKNIENFTSKVQDAIGEIVGCMCCMDDRTAKGQFRLAGSGILLVEEIGLDGVIDMVKNSDISEITSHDNCGAAKIYAQSKGLDESKADEYGIEFAKKLSKETDLPYRHIEVTKPHVARSIYIDPTEKFNNKSVAGLPEGFVVSSQKVPVSHIIAQVNVAITIATGDHGFGEKLNSLNPFFVFVLGIKGDNLELDEGIENIIKEKKGIVQVKYIEVK